MLVKFKSGQAQFFGDPRPIPREAPKATRNQFRDEQALRPRWQMPIDVLDLAVARDDPSQQLSQWSFDGWVDRLQLSG